IFQTIDLGREPFLWRSLSAIISGQTATLVRRPEALWSPDRGFFAAGKRCPDDFAPLPDLIGRENLKDLGEGLLFRHPRRTAFQSAPRAGGTEPVPKQPPFDLANRLALFGSEPQRGDDVRISERKYPGILNHDFGEALSLFRSEQRFQGLIVL